MLRVVLLCGRNIPPAPEPGLPPAAPPAGAAPDGAGAGALASYCQLHYGRQIVRAPIVRHSGGPVWNWVFSIALPADLGALAPADRELALAVLDAKTVGNPPVVGRCKVRQPRWLREGGAANQGEAAGRVVSGQRVLVACSGCMLMVLRALPTRSTAAPAPPHI